MAVAVTGHEPFVVDRQERSGRIGLRAGGPVFAQLEEEPLAVDVGIGILGLGHLDELPVAELEHVVGPECLLAEVEFTLEAGRHVLERADAHVVFRPLVDDLGVGELRPPLPDPGRPGVSRAGHRAGAEVGADQERVGIAPGHAALRLRQLESPRDECLLLEVELPDHLGVGTAARQFHEAACVVRLEDGDAMPHPVLLLGRREGVEIDHRLPGRLRLAVFLEARPPPHPLRVLGVAPEVVEVAADLPHHRDPVLGIEDREDPLLEAPEGVIVGQARSHLGIPLLDPFELLLAADILEPLVRVVRDRGCRIGRVGSECHGESE